MVENGSYISIKEAEKKFDRTRQTFYNYKRKGLIQSKKSWNKVYLSVADLDRIFWDYLAPTTKIESSRNSIEHNQSDTKTSQSIIDATYTHEIRVEALEEQVESIQKRLYNINNATSVREPSTEFEILYAKLQAQLSNLQDYTQNIFTKLLLEKKKRIFTWSYMVFVLLNTVIISFL